MLPFDPLPSVPPGTRIMTRPSWSDPGFMLAANEWQWSSVPSAGPAGALILPANPRRWGLIFCPPVTGIDIYFLAPDTVDLTLAFRVAGGGSHLRLTIFEYGGIVGAQWFMSNSSPDGIGVFELLISE